VKSALGQYIDRRFREEGVEIPFPQRDLHLRSVAPEAAGKLAAGRESKRPAGEEPRAGDEKG
jgi:small-conductance mechanosensitive channel